MTTLVDIMEEVRNIKSVLEEIEAFSQNDFADSAPEKMYFENIEDLLKNTSVKRVQIPLTDPTPKLDVYIRRLIRIMPPSYCNLFIKTEDKKHYFGVVDNENGLFVVFLPCEKAQKVNIQHLKENLTEL